MANKKKKVIKVKKSRLLVQQQPRKQIQLVQKPRPSEPSFMKTLLTEGGGLLGSMYGMPQVGHKAGEWLSKITGFGDYKVSKNSISAGTAVPAFTRGKRSVIVAHREFIGDVTGSTAFAVRSYGINPGLGQVAPWLAARAAGFSQYKIHGMVFEFLSTSATALNSTNTALGTVVMATQYNVTRPSFATKVEMENHEFSMSCKPSESMIHPIECDPRECPTRELYVRTGAVPSGQDQRWFDLGNFQIATVGMQAASVIGELWCSYEIEFFKPVLSTSPSAGATAYTSASSYQDLHPFSAAGTTLSLAGSLDGITASDATLRFASTISTGTYLIQIIWTGSSTACTLTTPTLSNLTANTSYPIALWTPVSGATSTKVSYTIVVDVDGYNSSGSTLVFAGLTLPSSGSLIQLLVTAVPRSTTAF